MEISVNRGKADTLLHLSHPFSSLPLLLVLFPIWLIFFALSFLILLALFSLHVLILLILFIFFVSSLPFLPFQSLHFSIYTHFLSFSFPYLHFLLLPDHVFPLFLLFARLPTPHKMSGRDHGGVHLLYEFNQQLN